MNNENLKNGLNNFLTDEEKKKQAQAMQNDPDMECGPDGVCVLKGDKSLVERINKKIITEDGRQLLF